MGYLEGLLTFRKLEYFFSNYILDHNFQIKNLEINEIEKNPTLNLVVQLLRRLNQKLEKRIIEYKSQKEEDRMLEQIIKLKNQKSGIMEGFN
jgi:hypothetical protein